MVKRIIIMVLMGAVVFLTAASVAAEEPTTPPTYKLPAKKETKVKPNAPTNRYGVPKHYQDRDLQEYLAMRGTQRLAALEQEKYRLEQQIRDLKAKQSKSCAPSTTRYTSCSTDKEVIAQLEARIVNLEKRTDTVHPLVWKHERQINGDGGLAEMQRLWDERNQGILDEEREKAKEVAPPSSTKKPEPPRITHPKSDRKKTPAQPPGKRERAMRVPQWVLPAALATILVAVLILTLRRKSC